MISGQRRLLTWVGDWFAPSHRTVDQLIKTPTSWLSEESLLVGNLMLP